MLTTKQQTNINDNRAKQLAKDMLRFICNRSFELHGQFTCIRQ